MGTQRRGTYPLQASYPPLKPWANIGRVRGRTSASTDGNRGFNIRAFLSPATITGIAVLGSIAAKSLAERLAEHDVWWHMRAGELIVATGSIPHADVFSYTAAGSSWVVQSWLADVMLHGIDAALGPRGIIVWRAVMLVAIYGLAARIMVRDAGHSVRTWALIALTAYGGVLGWIERPNLFSYLLVVAVVALARDGERRAWLAVPLIALWANLHAMVVLGVGILWLLAGVRWLLVLVRVEGVDRVKAVRSSLVAVVAVLASFLNPSGPFLWTFATRLVRTASSLATEWDSPSFHRAGTLPFLAMILLTLTVLAFARHRIAPTELALAAAFVALGLYAERNLPASSLVLGLVVARMLRPSSRGEPEGAPDRPPREALSPRQGSAVMVTGPALLAVLAVLTLIVLNRFPTSSDLAATADESLPVAAIRDLPREPVRLFIDDRWGGLAIYMRWPSVRVAIDGRAEVYGEQRIARYLATLAGDLTLFRTTCTTNVIVPATSGLAAALRTDPDWRATGSFRLDEEVADAFEVRDPERRRRCTGS